EASHLLAVRQSKARRAEPVGVVGHARCRVGWRRQNTEKTVVSDSGSRWKYSAIADERPMANLVSGDDEAPEIRTRASDQAAVRKEDTVTSGQHVGINPPHSRHLSVTPEVGA